MAREGRTIQWLVLRASSHLVLSQLAAPKHGAKLNALTLGEGRELEAAQLVQLFLVAEERERVVEGHADGVDENLAGVGWSDVSSSRANQPAQLERLCARRRPLTIPSA